MKARLISSQIFTMLAAGASWLIQDGSLMELHRAALIFLRLHGHVGTTVTQQRLSSLECGGQTCPGSAGAPMDLLSLFVLARGFWHW
jgi:hypothetical protein